MRGGTKAGISFIHATHTSLCKQSATGRFGSYNKERVSHPSLQILCQLIRPTIASSQTNQRLGIKAHYFPHIIDVWSQKANNKDTAELHVQLFSSLDVGINLLSGGPEV